MMLIIMVVAFIECFLCARSHSKHGTYIASFNRFQQLTEVDIIFYIVEMRKGGYFHPGSRTPVNTQRSRHMMENDGIWSWVGVSDHLTVQVVTVFSGKSCYRIRDSCVPGTALSPLHQLP